jgi:hypothetical protein
MRGSAIKPWELPPVSAGGVHAQHVLSRSRRLAVDLISHAANGHGHIAAGDRRHGSGTFSRLQRHRHRERSTEGQPLSDLEHAPRVWACCMKTSSSPSMEDSGNRYIIAKMP